MAGLIQSLDSPEEVRKFEAGSGHLELVNLDAGPVGRATFQPSGYSPSCRRGVVRARASRRR
jgi:hypothetical protein